MDANKSDINSWLKNDDLWYEQWTFEWWYHGFNQNLCVDGNDADSEDENDNNAHEESPQQPFKMQILFITFLVGWLG